MAERRECTLVPAGISGAAPGVPGARRTEADPRGRFTAVPIYEYRCSDCQRKFSVLIGMTAEPDDEACPHCGSRNARRLVSRFSRLKSEDDRMDELADRLESVGEPDSPAEMRRLVKEMGKAMDEDMSDELEEMLDADLSGESDDDFGSRLD